MYGMVNRDYIHQGGLEQKSLYVCTFIYNGRRKIL